MTGACERPAEVQALEPHPGLSQSQFISELQISWVIRVELQRPRYGASGAVEIPGRMQGQREVAPTGTRFRVEAGRLTRRLDALRPIL
jgi:hypothetical protein